MSDKSSQAVVAETAELRFSIRSLLWVTVGVALVAGTAGPYFRKLDTDDQASVGMLWGVCALLVTTWVGWNAWTRIQLERLAGRTILALAPRGKWFRNVRPWQTIFVGCFLIALGLYYLVIFSMLPMEPQNIGNSLLVGGVITFLISRGIATIWWNRKVQLREHGIMRGLRLLRWTHVTRHRWDADSGFARRGDSDCLALEGVDQQHKDVHFEMNVRPEQRAAVESLLRSLPTRIRAPALAGSHDEPAVVPLPYIPITEQVGVTTYGMVNAAIVLILFSVIVSLMASMTLTTPKGGFVVGGAAACLGAAVVKFYRTRSTRFSGTPLVRLASRVDWSVLAGAFVFALGWYYLDQIVPVFYLPLSFMFGIGCGAGMATVFALLSRNQFDLCENGVVLLRTAYWPWSRVRLSRWDRQGNGRLVLRCGWRRLVAKVPPGQREAVDAVLMEKLGAVRS